MITLNTNLSSLIAQSSLKTSTNKLNEAVERMSTGYKINHAKDNAANYSIAENMSTKLSAYNIAADNVAMGMDLVSTAEDIISNMQNKASRLHALSTQARNGTYGAQSIDAINSEANALISEIMRLYNTAEYNGISLFDRVAYTIASHLPQAGASGFIDENPIVGPTAECNGFINEVVEETPDVVVTNPNDLKTAIQNNTKIGIANAETLATLADLVNDEGITCQGKTIILTEDIDLSVYSNWESIGRTGNYFKGTFNGNGHVIKDLNITSANGYPVGLFADLMAASIINLGLEDVNINVTDNYTSSVGALAAVILGGSIDNCYVKGGCVKAINSDYVAGLLGDLNDGSVINCYTEVNVEGKNVVGGLIGGTTHSYDVLNCYSTGNVTGNQSVGGLIGSAGEVVIDNCYATGNVIGVTRTGGLLGNMSQVEVINCYATGNILGQDYTGGFIGELDSGIIENCYATGTVKGTNYVGGLVGISRTDIINSYATGNVHGTNHVGGLVGSGDIIENCYATGNVIGTEVVGGLAGYADNDVINCFSTSNVTGKNMVAGLVAITNGYIDNCYVTGDVVGTGSNIGGLLAELGHSNNISNSVSYSNVYGADSATTGSFIGCVTGSTGASISNCQAIAQDIDKIGGCTDTTLLDGITDVDTQKVDITLQVGINSDNSNQISFDTNFRFNIYSLMDNIDSADALEQIQGFANVLSEKATMLGAVSNRLESSLDSISVNIENLTSSRSTIRDADMAELSSTYIQQQILQQASATLLATANQSPSIALQLI